MQALSPRIMVVDDSSSMRLLISTQLRSLGFTDITMVSEAEMALDMIVSSDLVGKRFDVVITDRKMPRMDGIQLLRTIRSDPELEKTVVILITGEHEKSYLLDAVEARVNGFLQKPYRCESLGEILIRSGVRLR